MMPSFFKQLAAGAERFRIGDRCRCPLTREKSPTGGTESPPMPSTSHGVIFSGSLPVVA